MWTFNTNLVTPVCFHSCSTGNPADGSDTDEAKQFITTTNKKAAIKVYIILVPVIKAQAIPHMTIRVSNIDYERWYCGVTLTVVPIVII